VGTSLTAGLGLDPDSAYPAILQRKLDSAGVRIRVVNAGFSGETSAGALRRIEWARAPDRWTMIATTDFLARSFTWRWPGLGLVRGSALALLNAAGPAKSLLARQMMFGRR